MGVQHWTEDEFLNRIYGLGGGDERHLAACGQCRERWHQMEQRRSLITAESAQGEISHEVLAAQRRAIYRRLDERPARRFQWVSAFAATCMLVIGLLIFRPGQTPPVQPVAHNDDAVFADVYSLEQSSEPAASKTMQALFEEK